ncbi:LacI family DNA-binding transcriptional regulator [Candidimonas humi]|uniref:LacI family DNA-binding transcriptional regulator n=1 Tax=Candidimonas humi TaxID=683355 RepID=A0ABV8P148_9BURK|nr:LacI family DNA-binding transcriptional regulator [Candidimonas humi]MBV6305634.1 LacI family DNA-binding transcriptional regulator [Candidimonas humi]
MATKQRVTVLDVARLAGVSQGSVSRVITGKNWVSDRLRARVEAAVKQLEYKPNPHAQGLKSLKSRAVAALVSDISNPLHGTFLASAEEVLSAAGYLLFVSSTNNDRDRELELINAYGSGRVDGMIVAHSDENNRRVIKALQETGLPILFHDREPRRFGDAVIVDHAHGAYVATNYLLSLGHQCIALLSPSKAIRPGRERFSGYKRALEEANLVVQDDLVSMLGASDARAYDVTRNLLKRSRSRPTAIICLGTQMLAGVLAAINESGLSIPDDISIIGIGETDLVRLYKPSITAVKWDIAACGRHAAQILLQRFSESNAEKPSAGSVVRSPVELVLRDSCAAPRKQ